MDHHDADALAAEIARLEAELAETQTPHELAASLQRPALQHVMSQRDYVEVAESYADSDDDCSNLYSTAEASYDEITVATTELAGIAEGQEQAESSRSGADELALSNSQKHMQQRPTLDHFPQQPSMRSTSESHPASPKHASPQQQQKPSVAGFLAEIRPMPLTTNQPVSPKNPDHSLKAAVGFKHPTKPTESVDSDKLQHDLTHSREDTNVASEPKHGKKKVLKRKIIRKKTDTAPLAMNAPATTSDPVYEKYAKMLKIGLPEGAVRSAMEKDGVDVSVLGQLQNPAASMPKVPVSPKQNLASPKRMPISPKRSPATPKKSPVRSPGTAEKKLASLKRVPATPQKIPRTPKATPAPSTPVSSSETAAQDSPYAKYYQMLKIGLPEGAVQNAMERDGVDPSIVLGNQPTTVLQIKKPSASPRSATVSPSKRAPVQQEATPFDKEAARLEAEIKRIEAEITASPVKTKSNTPRLPAKSPKTPKRRNVSAPPKKDFQSPGPAPPAKTQQDTTHAKYHQMIKIGLPEGAVRNAMERDGVDPSAVLTNIALLGSPKVTSDIDTEAARLEAEIKQMEAELGVDQLQPQSKSQPSQDPAFAKYHQMIKIGLPEGAVRNAMERDGVDPSAILGSQPTQPPPPKTPVPAKQKSLLSVQAPTTPRASKDDPKYSKYFTMLEIGLPEGAVVNAMERDGVDPSAVIANHKPSPMRKGKKPKPSPIDAEAARLEAEIKQMEAEIAASQGSGESVPVQPSMISLLGAIENAATSRGKRLEENDGELYMQEVVPEVEAKHVTPQLSTSMAEMVMQRAVAREKRLEAGGEKRMRKVVIKEKDEYKKDFSNIVTDAAAMGRLTRLNEHTVEAVAQEKTPEEEWRSNGLLAIQWRSNHMSVIHDAARAGNEAKLPEHIVSNYEEEEQEGWDPETGEKLMSPRMRQLLELNRQVGEGQQKVDKLVLGRKEEAPKANSLLVKPMVAYNNVDDVKLPRRAPPKINPQKNAERLSKMTKEALKSGRPMVDISVGVAEIAWERRARLDRPGSLPKMKEKCDCPYCGNASPYQTFAYRELERKKKEQYLQRQQQKLAAHEQQHKEHEEGEVMPEEAAMGEEVGDDDDGLNEVERKRLERKRIREERRKLKQAVAEAEAAVAVAKAEADAAQQHCQPVTSSAGTDVRDTEQQQAAQPTPAQPALPTSQIVPQQKQPVTTAVDSESAVQQRISQWTTSPASITEPSKYAQPNPAAESAGCKCVIM